MNFTTDLPKKDPLVSYIVASAIKCEKFFPNSSLEGPVFRMHAVILNSRYLARLQGEQKKKQGEKAGPDFSAKNTSKKGSASHRNASNAHSSTSYILCHVRKVSNKKESSQEAEMESEAHEKTVSDSDQVMAGVLPPQIILTQEQRKDSSI